MGWLQVNEDIHNQITKESWDSLSIRQNKTKTEGLNRIVGVHIGNETWLVMTGRLASREWRLKGSWVWLSVRVCLYSSKFSDNLGLLKLCPETTRDIPVVKEKKELA